MGADGQVSLDGEFSSWCESKKIKMLCNSLNLFSLKIFISLFILVTEFSNVYWVFD